jgi:hypothetical protein
MTFAIILAGLTMRPTPPATAAAPGQTVVQVDPYGLQSTVSAKSLRNQDIGDLY